MSQDIGYLHMALERAQHDRLVALNRVQLLEAEVQNLRTRIAALSDMLSWYEERASIVERQNIGQAHL